MEYSEAGDRVGIGHASIGTTLDSVKLNGSLATDHAPDRPEALAGSAHCDELSYPHAVEGRLFTDFSAPTVGCYAGGIRPGLKDAHGVTMSAAPVQT
jgi:hypothetical protein